VRKAGVVLKKNWVKGRYMLTISTQELEQQAPKILEKKLYLFLKGVSMLNEIIKGISMALNAAFGDGYEIYQ